MIQTHTIEFQHEGTLLECFYAFDDTFSGERPLVLIAHDWTGRTDFTSQKAIKLAELGYIGFAMDMYGKGKIGKTKEEKSALMKPLISDREFLQKRLVATLNEAKKIKNVATKKIAAMGFCFGGLCALDLARTGADIAGVVSFHGALSAPSQDNSIKAKILALHGYNDPMVSAEEVTGFEKEMTEKKVDWQLHVYSNTMHAFTNPEANDPGFGTVYNASSDKRSWIAMKNFFEEIFA